MAELSTQELMEAEWDLHLFERVWERKLGHVERHYLAMDVWHRRLPEDRFHRRIAVLLARRWRRMARNYAIGYGLWAALWWVLMAPSSNPEVGPPSTLPMWLALAGLVAMVGALYVRWRVAPVALADPTGADWRDRG